MYFKTAELAGFSVFYREAGDASKPTIACLRFSLVVVPVPRPHSASGGSVSRHCARLPRHGVQRGAGIMHGLLKRVDSRQFTVDTIRVKNGATAASADRSLILK